MKYSPLIILLTLLTCCLAVNAQSSFNGNFESLDAQGIPKGWDLTYKNQNSYIVRVDSIIRRQGRFSVSMKSHANGQSGAIVYPIERRYQGKVLTLIGSLKTEEVTDGFAGIWIRTTDVDGKEIYFQNTPKNTVTGSTDWTEYMLELPYNGRQISTIEIGAMLVGSGKVWVDSLRLYVDYKPIDEVHEQQKPIFRALSDNEFATNSGIDTIHLTNAKIKHLSLLGELWGFLKYHHPAIAEGEFNWDAELFRILPQVLACNDDTDFSNLMENWTFALGDIDTLSDKLSPMPDSAAMLPDYGNLFTNNTFSPQLSAQLKIILNTPREPEHFYVGELQDAETSSFTNEWQYNSTAYPDAGQRLLALYRYWSMIQYFSPNRALIPDTWSAVLPRLMPKIIEAEDDSAYTKSIAELIASIHDSHAFIRSEVYEQSLGKFKLPYSSMFVDDKLVITGSLMDDPGGKQVLLAGDIITKINHRKVSSLVDELSPITPSSNRAAALRDMMGTHLFRNPDSLFHLEVVRNQKRLNTIVTGLPHLNRNLFSPKNAQAPSYTVIEPDIGYIYCGTYKNTDLDSIKIKFRNTKGIIIDMRGYPVDEMTSTLAAYFTSKPVDFAKFSERHVARPGLFVFSPNSTYGVENDDFYQGKVVVLVNELTQSNAEYVTMALQKGEKVITLGSTSAGADGNITAIHLPGDITTWLSGIGVYYPDGTNTQRVGVKIDKVVKPTVKGLAAERDEVLEAAKKWIAAQRSF